MKCFVFSKAKPNSEPSLDPFHLPHASLSNSHAIGLKTLPNQFQIHLQGSVLCYNRCLILRVGFSWPDHVGKSPSDILLFNSINLGEEIL